MAYNPRFIIEYYRRSGAQTTIVISEKDGTEVPQNILAYGNPLEITFEGDSNDIYQPTLGSGATIQVVVPIFQMMCFYTVDPLKFMVQVYNGVQGVNLFWQGFVNAEIYSESYSTPKGLKNVVTLHCNDGMALLDKIKYNTDAGGFLNGVKTLGDHIGAILGLLGNSYVGGVQFTYILTSHELQVQTASENNLFLYLGTWGENYVDEQGESMSCRDVLNGIMRGLGLVMFFSGDKVYIIDPISMTNVNNSRRYDRVGFNNESTVEGVGIELDVSNQDITWGETGQLLDRIPSVSQIILNYNPYNCNNIMYDFSDEKNMTAKGTWLKDGSYFVNRTVMYSGWSHTDINNNPQTGAFIGVKETQYGDPTYFLKISINALLTGIAFITFPKTLMSLDYNNSLKLSFQAYAQTKEATENIFSTAVGGEVNFYYVYFSIMIGTQYWKDDHWEAGSTGNYKQLLSIRQEGVSDAAYVANPSISQVADQWVTGSRVFPLSPGPGGTIVPGPIYIVFYMDSNLWSSQAIQLIFIKDIRIEGINNINGRNVENEGIKATGKKSTNLTGKDSQKYDLIQGTGPTGFSRGAFFSITNQATIDGLYRGSNKNTTQELVLQNMVSQYNVPRILLTGKLNVVDYLLTVRKYLISDTNHLSTRKFLVCKGKYIDREEILSDMELVEIVETRDNIIS